MKRLQEIGIIIYHSTHLAYDQEVTGTYFSNYCIELNPLSDSDIQTKPLFEWIDCEKNTLIYGFKIHVDKSIFLILGNNEEDAFLNLLRFAERYK